MGLLQNKKAVIFDLDGTIVDSLGVWNRVDVLLAKELGCSNPDAEALHRLREDALERYKSAAQPYTCFCGEFGKFFGSSLSAEEVHALRFQISRKVLKSDVRLRDGVDKVIRKCADLGMKLAIATTTKRANIDIYSDVNELIRQKIHLRDFFCVVISMEDVSQIKPDPECYLKALDRLGVEAKEALVIEDSRVGVMAAHAAGIDAAVVREPFSESNRQWLMREADWYFEDFVALAEAIGD